MMKRPDWIRCEGPESTCPDPDNSYTCITSNLCKERCFLGRAGGFLPGLARAGLLVQFA